MNPVQTSVKANCRNTVSSGKIFARPRVSILTILQVLVREPAYLDLFMITTFPECYSFWRKNDLIMSAGRNYATMRRKCDPRMFPKLSRALSMVTLVSEFRITLCSNVTDSPWPGSIKVQRYRRHAFLNKNNNNCDNFWRILSPQHQTERCYRYLQPDAWRCYIIPHTKSA